MILLNIPAHKGCVNCGECCGVIPVTYEELQHIIAYIKDHPGLSTRAQKNAHRMDACPFRDNTAKSCMIYPVRPVICILMGVCAGMTCKHGNSAYIDGRPFLRDHNIDEMVILNELDWEEISNA